MLRPICLVISPLGQQLLKQDLDWPPQLQVSWLSPLNAVDVVQLWHVAARDGANDKGKGVDACDGAVVVGRVEGEAVGLTEGMSEGC